MNAEGVLKKAEAWRVSSRLLMQAKEKVIESIKISTGFERMSDLAENICERVIELNEEPQLKPYIDIPRMANWTMEMVRESLDAFARSDSAQARKVCADDDFVDNPRTSCFASCCPS